MSDDQMSSLVVLRDRVDAILVPRGFSTESGVEARIGQLLWCAAADDFANRFPDLPVSREPAGGWGQRCTDLTIDIDDTRRIKGVHLEGHDLGALFAGLGLAAGAQRATALLGSPVTDCVVELPSLLVELLDNSGEGR